MKGRPSYLLSHALVVAPVMTSALLTGLVLVGCPSLKNAPLDAGAETDTGVADLDAGDDASELPETGFTIVRHMPEAGALRALSVTTTEQVYLAGDDGVILEKVGAEWQTVVLGPGVDVTGIWSSGPTEALAVATQKNTNKGPIFRRGNGVWAQIGTAPHGLRTVWGIDQMRYAGGNDGVIYSGPPIDPLRDGFQQPLPPDVPDTLFAPIIYSIGGNSTKAVMAAADFDITVFFDGATWHSFQDPIDRTRSFRSIWGFPGPAVEIYQGANYFGLWRFTSSTAPVLQFNEEKDQLQNPNRWIWGMWGPSGDKLVCVGDAGRIMTYDKKSGKVVTQPSPTVKNLYAVGGTSLDDIWIVGEEQLVLHGHLSF
jgi:hypothetical protein